MIYEVSSYPHDATYGDNYCWTTRSGSGARRNAMATARRWSKNPLYRKVEIRACTIGGPRIYYTYVQGKLAHTYTTTS